MRPGPALWLAWLLLAGVGLAVVLEQADLSVWTALLALLLLALLIDAKRLRALLSPEFARDLPRVLPVGVERDVVLRLFNRAGQDVQADLHDLHPGQWPVRGLPRRLSLPAGRELQLSYRLTPLERGQFEFSGCDLRLHSPWRLWWQRRRLGAPAQVRVFPNFAPLAALALVGAEQASRVIGAHLQRRRGEGTEFQELREYRTGDSLRQIDWKASQRARKLISRQYQDERNQQVLLVLDCGRRMLAQDEGLAHFDHALNAALVVAHIALRQGDAVGLMAVGAELRFLPPQRGLPVIEQLLDGVFDLRAQAVATDYLEAATQIGQRQSRRALVLLLTNARDEDADELAIAVRQLQKRHLVCVASLREQVLDDVLERDVHSLQQALRLGATAHYIELRRRAHESLRLQGADVLDVTCSALPSALVQHYLAVKRSARL